jgi:outer membrane protein OmpA-like peptidoglycan-associated protein
LVARGIDPARIQTKSLGEHDTDPLPKDWRTDRRVDVHVAPSP